MIKNEKKIMFNHIVPNYYKCAWPIIWKKNLLIYSEIKQKTKIDNFKSSLKAIELDSSNKFKDDFKILNVFFSGFSDGHFKSCQKGDSIYIKSNYTNDSFNIDNKYGEVNTKK